MIPLESLGASKIASESILKANSKSKKIDTISMRVLRLMVLNQEKCNLSLKP